MSQELFQQILSDLKKCQPTDKPYAILDAITSDAIDGWLWWGMCQRLTCADLIKVMESGIFRDGGLKKEPSGNYPLKDLALFVLKSSSIIFGPDLEEIFRDSISAFDKVPSLMKNLKFAAMAYRSKVHIKNLDRIEQELKDIKSDLLNKPQRKLGFRLPKDLRDEPDRVDDLISLFKEQVPPEAYKSHKYSIAGAIQTILSLADRDGRQDAIAQRMYRFKSSK
jgi:hypothetical protein